MEVRAQAKYVSISPKKAREVADLVRGKNAKEALEMLKFMPQVSAKEIGKALKSAMANAETNFNLEKDALLVSRITVDGGPILKRWQPRAKGAAYEIKKRTSQLTVVVSGDVKTKKAKTEKKGKEASESLAKEKAEHKMEVERPQFDKTSGQGASADVKSNFFRRKTG